MPARSTVLTTQPPQPQAEITPLMAGLADITTAVGGATYSSSTSDGGVRVPADEDDGSPLCSVCMDAPPSTLLAPCGHIVLCHKCCESVRAADNLVSEIYVHGPACPTCATNNGRSFLMTLSYILRAAQQFIIATGMCLLSVAGP